MGSEPILRLTPGQHAKVVRQIRRKCANFDRENGYCLPLDDICPQTLTMSLLCRYYRAAVLPDDPALEAEIRKTGQRCQICGAWYSPKGRNAKYCPSCAGSAAEKEEGKPFRFLSPGTPVFPRLPGRTTKGGAIWVFLP